MLTQASVPYPADARGDALVRVIVTVNADGSVRDAQPIETEEPFASAARSAILGWRFEPATRAGRAVAAKIAIEIQFHAPEPVEAEPDRTYTGHDRSGSSAEASQTDGGAGARRPSRAVAHRHAHARRSAANPGTFGNPFRAIETMPGVTPLVSGLPFFFVRGAPPGNVGYFLDGVQLPLLFHVGAGPSVVHPGLIERVDLYPGGYPARYGRFAGGIVSGETAKPSADLHGEYNVRLFDAGALLETPFAEGRGSALVAGRYSYTALLLSLLSPDITLSYWDYQARLGYGCGKRDRVSVFVFGSYDFLGQKGTDSTLTLFGTEFHRVDAHLSHALARGGNLRMAMNVGLKESLRRLKRAASCARAALVRAASSTCR
ncbi:MAG: TonB family protein [Polyangiaceae bacterium]